MAHTEFCVDLNLPGQTVQRSAWSGGATVIAPSLTVPGMSDICEYSAEEARQVALVDAYAKREAAWATERRNADLYRLAFTVSKRSLMRGIG